MTKITTKMWLAKVAAIFTHRTSLLHRFSPPASFYSKTKIGYSFNFHSSFGVLIFHFWHAYLNDLLFCTIKSNENNRRCTTEGEKSNKCCALNHTILFVLFKRNSSGISLSQLSISSFLQKIHREKQKF